MVREAFDKRILGLWPRTNCTYLKQGYDLVTPLSFTDAFTMIAQIAANLAGWLQCGELGPRLPTTIDV